MAHSCRDHHGERSSLAIARLWWGRIGLTGALAAGAVATWALYDVLALSTIPLAVAIVLLVGTVLFLLFSVPFRSGALAYANGKRS
jgi:hypothetical protein